MRNKRNNAAYIANIRDAIARLEQYVSTHTSKNFENNDWDQAAVIRFLEIIGEASAQIDTDFQTDHPDIPWRKLKNLRNILIHDYADVDINIVWNIISRDIPELKKCLKNM